MVTLGLFGNFTIIGVYWRSKTEKTIAYLLTFNATVDNLLLLASFSIFTLANCFHLAVESVPYLFACAQTASTLSVWLDCFMAFERYLAVCRPIKHRRWSSQSSSTLIGIGILTILAAIYELPRFWEVRIAWVKHCDGSMDWRPQGEPVRNTTWFRNGKLLAGYLL